MIKFIKENDPNDMNNRHDLIAVEVRVIHPDATIPDLLKAFEYFMRACGYQVETESLDFKEEE